MRLTLSVLRCPETVTPETHTVRGGEFRVGRGPEGVEWVLQGATNLVSRHHFTVLFRSGEWYVVDESANGTFSNNDEVPIGKGNEQRLRDHDRLSVGPYEIEVLFVDDEPAPVGDRAGYDAPGWIDEPVDGSWLSSGTRGVGGSPAGFPPGGLLPPGWDDEEEVAGPSPVPVPVPVPVPRKWHEPEPPAHDDHGSLFAAFAAGVGLPDARPPDPAGTLHDLGEAFRALVAGLRAVLIARASIKSEFRIEQTMIRARGNNPLKFSANDDDAISALLGVGRRTDMKPAGAVADALRDVRLHELASMAAMQSAVRALMEGLDPEKVWVAAEQGGGKALLPGQRKARAWDAYVALHARTLQALSDDFDSAFGKAFARAYEEALDELGSKDRT